MEYLKAWVWKEKKLQEQGKAGADPTLVKYVENLVQQMQGLMDTKLIRRTKSGNFELAELADAQVEVRQLKERIVELETQIEEYSNVEIQN